MSQVILKTIKTPNQHYVYDRNTNSLLEITPEEYCELQKVECKELEHDQSPVIQKYQRSGFLQESTLREIEHPRTNLIEYLTEHKLHQMILQVTQNCNLRCSYCAYSGNYMNRSHTGKRMSFETAKKAIDYYIEHSNHSNHAYIGFYGGEPLLEFQLIKECVDYAEAELDGKEIFWNITTNATLLNEEIVEYLIEHKINVTISLDGPKEIHDKNRKFANGQGSYDIILDNLNYIKENYPDFFKTMLVNTVLDTNASLKCVHEFYKLDKIFSQLSVSTSAITPTYANIILDYSEENIVFQKYDYFKILLYMIGKISKEIRPMFYQGIIGTQKNLYDGLNFIKELPQKHHHGGPCTPGANKLFVSSDGCFFPCERVSEESEVMQIGHIDSGLDMDKVKNFINAGKSMENECLHCWNLMLCSICPSEVDDLTQISKEKYGPVCKRKKITTIEDFQRICFLKENHYDFSKENAYE